jgi:hypothetical protein
MVWFWITHTLGIGVEYIVSGVMVAAGIYLGAVFNLAATNPFAWLLRPLRYVGYALVIAGVAYGYGTYRESVGGASVMAEWKAKNYEQQIANLKRDLGAAKLAAAFKAQEAKQLSEQKQEADGKIADYERSVQELSSAVAVCRRAAGDDDRRMCDILGNAAPGCRNSR